MYDLILTLHFLGLWMGGASGIGLLVIGATAASAPVEHRPSIGRAVMPLRMAGMTGVALLVITGFIQAAVVGAWSNGSVWFWIKLLGVAVLIFGIVMGSRAGKKAMTGDAAAAAQARTIGMLNVVVLVLIVLSATIAFN